MPSRLASRLPAVSTRQEGEGDLARRPEDARPMHAWYHVVALRVVVLHALFEAVCARNGSTCWGVSIPRRRCRVRASLRRTCSNLPRDQPSRVCIGCGLRGGVAAGYVGPCSGIARPRYPSKASRSSLTAGWSRPRLATSACRARSPKPRARGLWMYSGGGVAGHLLVSYGVGLHDCVQPEPYWRMR